jgi:hypothetical protein
MPTLDRITIYPVKSLDGLDLEACDVLESAGLENDRRWRLVDMDGRVLNAKRSPLFHAIRAEYELDERLVTLWLDPAAVAAAALPAADLDRLRGHGWEPRWPTLRWSRSPRLISPGAGAGGAVRVALGSLWYGRAVAGKG